MKAILSTVAALMITGAANATVVDVTISSPVGATWVDYVGAGPIGDDSFNMDFTFYTMNEQQGVTLAGDVAVAGGSIAAGTEVSSHYVWFDPERLRHGLADITFDGRILGIIIERPGLQATEAELGLAGVTYEYPSLVGLESYQDFASYVGNVLTIDWRASSPGDHIRVITAAIPVPAAGGLLALGLLGLGALRRRKSA
jgi:hypothetical protein